jgi:hypothetical protein
VKVVLGFVILNAEGTILLKSPVGGIVPLAGPTIIREPGGYLQAMRGPALEGVLMKVRVLVTAIVSLAVYCAYADEFGVFSSSPMQGISSQPQVGDALNVPATFTAGASKTFSWSAGQPASFHTPVVNLLTANTASSESLGASAYSLPSLDILSASELHWTASTPTLTAPMTYREAARIGRTLPGLMSDFNTRRMEITQPALHHLGW